MVDNINNFGNGKEWTKIDATTKDTQYKNELDKKISSILNGEETISISDLQKNSMFANLSEKAMQRMDYIASIDGDKTTLNSEELRVLMSLADATLKNNTFVFDGKINPDKNSGLEQANERELKAVIKNLVINNAKKKISTVDTSKFDQSKDFTTKIASADVDESMFAMQEKLKTDFIDKNTGKNLSLPQIIVKFTDFVKKSYDKDYDNFYEDVCLDFEAETGIKVSNFDRCRCMGDGDTFIIGDWKYEQGNITNTKTGEKIQVKRSAWGITDETTVPAANGNFCRILEYNDGKGTTVKYNYNDSENLAPTGVNITSNGEFKTVNYERKETIDPNLYNFVES